MTTATVSAEDIRRGRELWLRRLAGVQESLGTYASDEGFWN